MYGNFFGRRGDRQPDAQMSDEVGRSGQGPGSQHFSNKAQPSFQDANWNGLSPLNKDNQLHYQKTRETRPDYVDDEWHRPDIEPASQTRKRFGSPQLANDHPAKRVHGQLNRNEVFTPQRRAVPHSVQNNTPFQDRRLINRGMQQYEQPNSLGQYSHTEYQLPPPFEINARSSSWMGPDIPNGERWGSIESGGFGQMSPQNMTFQQHGFRGQQSLEGYNCNDPIFISGGSAKNFQRGQTMNPNAFQDFPRRQRGVTIAPDSRQGYLVPQTISLVTPESVHRRRNGGQTSTNSGSTDLRRATETEPTDLDDWDSDAQDYKSTRFQSYIPVGGVAHDSSNIAHSGLRVHSVMPGSGKVYQPQFTQAFNDGNHCDSPALGSLHCQSFNVFGPVLKTEESYEQNTQFRGPSCQPAPNSLHRSRAQTIQRQIDVEQDPESGEDDTIENIMRKKAWSKKVKAAGNASSRDTLSKPFDFGGSQRNTSGYSSQEVETTSKAREERQESTLSRIRGPDSTKTNKLSNPSNISTLFDNGDVSRHVIIKQTAAQKAAALEKEKAELHRQIEAKEKISQAEKRAQEVKDLDELFEEPPVDETALARIKKSKEVEKARKYAAEDAKIIQQHDKRLQEDLAATRKQRAGVGQEEKQAEKKQRVEEKRLQEKKREEERLRAKRKSAAELMRIKRVMEEEARLEALKMLEVERRVAKKRASTLQSFKKTDNKQGTSRDTSQLKGIETVQDSGDISDGGMFVSDDVVPVSDELPKVLPAVAADKEATDRPADVQKPEAIAANDKPASMQKSDNVVDEVDVTLIEMVEAGAKPETLKDKPDSQLSAEPPIVQKSDSLANNRRMSSAATVSGVEKPGVAANRGAGGSTDAAPVLQKSHTPAATVNGTLFSEVINERRRNPLENARPRINPRTAPDPIRFTGGGHVAAQDIQDSDQGPSTSASHARKKSLNRSTDKSESQTQAKLQKTLKEIEEIKVKAKAEEVQRNKEWDARMKQLGAMLILQGREDITVGRQRASSGKNHNLVPEASKDGQPLLSSKINFVSTLESQAKERQKTEEARLAKYEKDRATCRRRYDREIRIVLNGQGIEPDDEKVSKQVEEKMVLWEENRRKKERRESGGKELSASLNQRDSARASDAERDPASPPTLQNTDDEGVKDPETQKEQERARATRAGVEFLASQNKASNDFAKAASKFRIQDFESDESEEDPDDEPETQATPAAQQTVEAPEEMAGVEVDEMLNPAALDASIIPPLPEIPEPDKSKTAFLPDIVNPREEDMMHSYSVRHRAERDNNVYDSVVLGSFHSLEEANAFAQLKLSEFYLGPSTGKSETHSDDNLYVGQVTTNKNKDHSETVWVTREIVYIGDTANVKRGDIKTIIVPKVFNVLQVMQDEDGKHAGSIIHTTSIKALANKKAADHFLALSKPSRPRLDSLAFYNNTVVPSVRQSLEQAEAQDVTVDFEGEIPDTDRAFSISISENDVVGPRN